MEDLELFNLVRENYHKVNEDYIQEQIKIATDYLRSDNLIDRQGAIEHAISFWKDNDGDSAMQMIIDYLRTVPTIDAVEVVRCKECKYRGEYFSCPIQYRTEDNFFCGKGDRKE